MFGFQKRNRKGNNNLNIIELNLNERPEKSEETLFCVFWFYLDIPNGSKKISGANSENF